MEHPVDGHTRDQNLYVLKIQDVYNWTTSQVCINDKRQGLLPHHDLLNYRTDLWRLTFLERLKFGTDGTLSFVFCSF